MFYSLLQSMVVSEDQDGKSGDCAGLSRDPSRPNLTVGPSSSRKGGREEPKKKKTPTVIVDMREFRSDLPSLIHRRGIEIEPVTLQVCYKQFYFPSMILTQAMTVYLLITKKLRTIWI